ncbi:phospho-N-acetylmuramoyl-pentapeptide-transferase [Lachnotalea glycerini]|jgi:phospho-N-acetylmuramoyl-pentapeptide-transferase|uniref:Phospho-N-acetylmuramoyl-pentapeptide-transferase n=1 Tax=Lachnotalea glycerini TaxID=1763509 RepID=A0A255ILF3_9FIRM|nr:phospho-N-acetylmuramoyl-pentapeptide-transferase [Lachnotalea glycerini]PXV89520.1 phospho-N-acetylmuramoyl-pentapeptide-transferase [Lachnotalea glycerini]RDY32299.1 phospho-N-acetylmuramoyl-pentapeptide-transferase [Lachnotalea glycerini]
MDYKVVIPVIAAFIISAISGPGIIKYLTKLKAGQTVREDGPQTHLKKTGTPTMGGVLILLSIIIVSLFYIQDYPKIIPILFVTLGFGIIGFLDDYIKVVLKRSLGLTVMQKMTGEIMVTVIFAYYIINYSEVGLEMLLPFSDGKYVNMGILTIPIMFIAMIGTVNGVNFTDGLDGLASSVTVLVATFFSLVAITQGSGIEPITCAVVGSLLGFLLFNAHPARVFMGDTGSLALGGFVAASAYMLKMPLFILIVGLIYLVEVISVMMQVTYFKLTKGKRIFKMAPIHHHFELCGWSETKVVTVFTIITAVLCLLGLLAM